jgi:hypothetical protein
MRGFWSKSFKFAVVVAAVLPLATSCSSSRSKGTPGTTTAAPPSSVTSPSAPTVVAVPEDVVSVTPEGARVPTWEGLVRHNPTLISLKGKWDDGSLAISDGEIRWRDARDSRKNLLIPERALSEQFLTCVKKSGGNECFEWGFRTSNGEEYRFRDAAWTQGSNDKILAIHDFFKSRHPSLVDSSRPVDEK